MVMYLYFPTRYCIKTALQSRLMELKYKKSEEEEAFFYSYGNDSKIMDLHTVHLLRIYNFTKFINKKAPSGIADAEAPEENFNGSSFPGILKQSQSNADSIVASSCRSMSAIEVMSQKNQGNYAYIVCIYLD